MTQSSSDGSLPAHNGADDRPAARAKDVLVAWLPAVALCVLTPFAIYLPNQYDYDYDLSPVLPFVLGGVGVCALLSGLALVSSRIRRPICMALFYVGVFSVLSDILAPAPLGILEDFTALDLIDEPIRLTLIQAVIAVALLVCWAKVPFSIVRDLGSVLVLGLLVSQVVVVASGLSSRTHLGRKGSLHLAEGPARTAPKAETKGNIYQFVFDGFSSCLFLDSLSRSHIEDRFAGFTFFRKNRSSYIYTPLSYSSFMRGSHFGGGDLRQWMDRTLDSGMVEQLYRNGYAISYYPIGLRFVHRRATFVRMPDEKVWADTNFARIWLIRVTPNPLRQEVNDAVRAFSAKMRNRSDRPAEGMVQTPIGAQPSSATVDRCCPVVRDFLRDESTRPAHGQYVYFHIFLPHPPFLWDCACGNVTPSDYTQNCCCALRLMGELVDGLQRLGRYEDSTLIIHGDHGWELSSDTCEGAPPDAVPAEVAERIAESTRGLMTPKHFLDRTRALLLVKPPHASGPLRVSDAPTQLADLPATVLDLTGTPGDEVTGRSVFSIKPDEPREIHFFSGYKRAGKSGGVLVLGKHFRQTQLGHFTYTNGVGWKLYPAVPVSWGPPGLLP